MVVGAGRWQLAGAVVVAGLALATAVPARAEAPAATAWWWRASRGPVVVPSPAVPEGGLWVANEARDALAVSALRSAGEPIAAVALDVAEIVGEPAVVACPADIWEPAVGGTWEARPAADCDVAAVAGIMSKDRSTMSFDLAGLDLDAVTLVPAPGSAPFSVTFAGPDDSSLQPAAAGPGAPTPRPEPTPSPAPRPVAPSAPFVPPPLGSSGLAFVPDPGFVPPTSPTPATAQPVAPSPLPAVPAGGGARTPAALAIAASVLGVWGWRSRAAVAAAADHLLAAPLGGGEGASVAAEGLLAADVHGPAVPS